MNKGFTLIELITVLALMSILLTVAIIGGLSYQDWAKFNHEETAAEEIFYAAQNELTTLNASNALEVKITSNLLDGDNFDSKYILGQSNDEGTLLSSSIINTIKYDTDKYYSWEEIWNNGNLNNQNLSKQKRTILSLQAVSGDYDKYLDYLSLTGDEKKESSFDKGTVALFTLITPYIQDKSILNSSIIIEFSPETAQIFSVSFSDINDLSYDSTKDVNILDRTLQVRKDNMIGYFSVDKLTETLNGQSSFKCNLELEIKNEDTLSFIVHDLDYLDNDNKLNIQKDKIKISLYNGDLGVGNEELLAEIEIDLKDLKDHVDGNNINNIEKAGQYPFNTTVNILKGKFAGSTLETRIPIWTDNMYQDIHIEMDAADIQAQSFSFHKYINNEDTNFKNTFSIYKLGLLDINYIYGKIQLKRSGTLSEPNTSVKKVDNISYSHDITTLNDMEKEIASLPGPNGQLGECIAFDSVEKNENEIIYNISSMRHFYNIRYITDYKENYEVNNTFKVINNLDWDYFKNGPYNYFLNSYSMTTPSGIDYAGTNIATNMSGFNTSSAPFPGFRALSKGDKFTQDGSFKISNLNIKFTANVIYGVYDSVFFKPELQNPDIDEMSKIDWINQYEAVKEACMANNFTSLLGPNKPANLNSYSIIDSSNSSLTRGGLMPLGLFAENLGEISNIILDDINVVGMEKVNNTVVYTCMVGGFTGNNFGTLENLKVLNTNNNSKINGRTDVGGIVGRESFALTESEAELKLLENYASVSGMENVGGIVGRAYTNYVNDNTSIHNFNTVYGDIYISNSTLITDFRQHERYGYYHDGYFITDNYKSMTGVDINRVTRIKIKDCKNRGKVSGDPLVYANKIDNVSKSKCAFIGGIAGITMDGFIYDDKNINYRTPSSTRLIQKYAQFFKDDESFIPNVVVENCDSFVEYTDSEIANIEKDEALSRDLYVGGLIGYARLTVIKDCNNTPDNYDESVAPKCFVLGSRYVGGIAGCSDMSRYDKTGDYAATNYNVVIGRRYVGGAIGGNGIGDFSQQKVSFRDPSMNQGQQPSQTKGDKLYRGARYIRNSGIALLIKSDTPYGDGNTSNDNITACCGGIIGVTRQLLTDCDNIQPQAVKNYEFELITNGAYTDYSNLTNDEIVNIINNSKFGGTAVGGIAGLMCPQGYINPGINNANTPSATEKCRVDAIIYGENCIGGLIGSNNSDGASYAHNSYLVNDNGSTGSVIIGDTAVGGLYGRLCKDYLVNKEGINADYTVYGKYAVGGIVGTIENNSKMQASISGSSIKVQGLAYVGGYFGVCETNNKDGMNINTVGSNKALSNMSINGTYFVGGIGGAVVELKNNSACHELKNLNKIKTENVTVSADYFAGGQIGFFNISPSNGYKNIYSLSGKNKNGQLIQAVEKNLINKNAYELLDKDLTTSSPFTKYTTESTISVNIENNIPVSSKYFAGGYFGYIPENALIKLSNFKNNASITTTEIFTKNGIDYSYIGGIVGRVPTGMNIENCFNLNSNIISQATYVGGLTEENNGTIGPESGLLENNTAYNLNTIAPFVGINNGVIRNCKNNASITGISSGICLYNSGVVEGCINLGTISSGAGIVKENNQDKNVVIKNNRNYGQVSGYGISGTKVSDSSTFKNNFDAALHSKEYSIAPLTTSRNFYLDSEIYNSETSLTNNVNGVENSDEYIYFENYIFKDDNLLDASILNTIPSTNKFNSYFNLNNSYKIIIDTISPSSGITMHKLRLYWKYNDVKNYVYDITLYYNDTSITYSRNIGPAINNSTGSDFYDEIYIVDENGNYILPTRIKISFDNSDYNNEEIKLDAITYFDGLNREKMFVDVDNKLPVNNSTDIYTNDFGYKKFTKNIGNIEDSFPKQLYIVNKDTCNLHFTRFGLLIEDPVITNVNYSNVNSTSATTLYNELDSKVMEFMQSDSYPDSIFVD